MFEAESVYSVLKPMFYLTKVVGLAPFNLSKNDNYSGGSTFSIIWSIFMAVFLGGISFFSLTTREENPALIAKLTDYLHSRLSVAGVCVVIILACIFKGEILAVVKDVSLVDGELTKLGLNFNIKNTYRRSKIYSTISSFTVWLLIFWVFLVDILVFTKLNLVSIGQLFAYCGPTLTTFVQLQFCTFVLLLKQRFSWLNNKMSELKLIGKPVQRYDKREKILSAMRHISLQHHELCTISSKVNKIYSFQILLVVLQAFLTIIAVAFYLARLAFADKFVTMPFRELVYYVNMLVFHLAVIIVLVVTCSKTEEEARKAGIILHKVASLDVFADLGYVDLSFLCFSTQLMHHNVKYTACKLFPIDETLIYTVVSAAAMYLIIVLQFELGIRNDKG